LLPVGANVESDEDPDLNQALAQKYLDYRHQNRFIILALVALTPTGVKFFKAAQSSFEEYLMNDPKILMSATTYSLSLSLMSLPLATLIGGAMLDYKAKKEAKQQRNEKNGISKCLQKRIPREQSCLGTSRMPSYSAICFLAISLLGIIIYGYGLEILSSIPVGLAGSTIFGLGEGCVVVASRTFVAHAFYGSDGAFAQGVLVAMNNLAMMASKISLPWLIENEKKMRSITSICIHNISLDCVEDENFAFDHNMTIPNGEHFIKTTEHDDNNIWIGVVACCIVQLMSLTAGIIYAWWFGLAPLPQSLQMKQQEGHEKPSKNKKAFLLSNSSLRSRVTACFEKLPITFWIVALGRAIFVVVFKVFTRNSNSFLMVRETSCRHASRCILTNLDL
jgi:MFS family permease